MENRHALLDLRRLPERRAAVAMANERRPGGRRITWGDKGYDAPDVPLMLCRGSLPQLITVQSRRLQEPSGFALPQLRPRQLRHRHV